MLNLSMPLSRWKCEAFKKPTRKRDANAVSTERVNQAIVVGNRAKPAIEGVLQMGDKGTDVPTRCR
jgi:hypothetical protein